MKRAETKTDIARAFGLHPGTVERYVKLGLPCDRRGGRLLFSTDEVRAWMEANGRTGEPGRPEEGDALSSYGVPAGVEGDAGGGMKMKLARAELARRLALARLYNLRYERERGKVLDAGEVERGRVQRVLTFKAALLALPYRAAPMLVGRSTTREVEDVIYAEVIRLLEDFSGTGKEFNGYLRIDFGDEAVKRDLDAFIARHATPLNEANEEDGHDRP